MTGKSVRKIVHIDPDKCDGCGLCAPSCAEGAIEIIEGKARLLGDDLCDGLGNCLGVCPQDAITIEERAAEAFDEAAVEAHLKAEAPAQPAESTEAPARPRACPGMRMRQLGERKPAPTASPAGGAAQTSQLTHWPVQLTLLPEQGPIWDDVDVVLAADCVAYAMPDFHARLLTGRTLAIACPKLDDGEAYVAKLARIFAANNIRSVTVTRMEVPCCGLDTIARQALSTAGKEFPLTVVTVGVAGEIQNVNGIPLT